MGPNQWRIANDPRIFYTRDEARRAGNRAHGNAQQAYANYVNALITPERTSGEEAAEEYEAAKAEALARGVSLDAWENSPEVRAAFMPNTRSGAELWEEYKRNKRGT